MAKQGLPVANLNGIRGYYSFPVKQNGVVINKIIQFGDGATPLANGTVFTSMTQQFHVPFPNRCTNVVATDLLYNMSSLDFAKNTWTGRVAIDFNSEDNDPKTGFRVLCEGAFSWWAEGY
ncbi:gp53-like domain-containing protein [Kluyvera intermedia]|uniref:Putative tail fiber protein gp53-like C-terminal domain-containing protein n=1 Tax=Kluyvera intermedia TaxID=61648 RepID=A0AA95FX35_KLUIN|nr:hypothetical protein [Kluyvera intermedia]WGL54597.1 hypothetical protein QBD33_12995 [Kluyvera intermedia]